MTNHTKHSAIQLDKVGVCSSLVCILHCLAGPILLIAGADSLLWMVDQEWVELSIIGFTLIVGSISFFRGYIRHRQHFIPVLFLTGFLLIVNGEGVSQLWLAVLLSVVGASVIAYAHFQNLRWKRYAFTN